EIVSSSVTHRWMIPPLFPHSRQCEHSQQDSLESELAAVAVEPLLQCVGTSARSAATDGNGLLPQRERDVGISRGTLHLRGIAQLRIDCADHVQDSCTRLQFAGGTAADHDDFARHGWTFL